MGTLRFAHLRGRRGFRLGGNSRDRGKQGQCGLARSHVLAGENPDWVVVHREPSIEPCGVAVFPRSPWSRPVIVAPLQRYLSRQGQLRLPQDGAIPRRGHIPRPPKTGSRMARPLRIGLPGALYHVTSRGDGREDIYRGDTDRQAFLAVFEEVCERFNWWAHAYCLMTNHYHLLVETPDGNLSKGMRQLNGVYTQRFNSEHGRCGHVFQGRYKAIIVQKESYLTALSRYVVLNPVRARMVARPEGLALEQLSGHAGRSALSAVAASGLVALDVRGDPARGGLRLSPFRRGRHRRARALGAATTPGLSRL